MENDQNIEPIKKKKGRGHIWGGMFILAIGTLLLARQVGADIPDWVFTWQMALIAIGIFSGIKDGFRGGAWFIMILIGGIFMYDRFDPDMNMRKFIWPAVIIGIGLLIIFRPRGKCRRWKHGANVNVKYGHGKEIHEYQWPKTDQNVGGTESQFSSVEDYLDITSVFGGVKRIVVSKNFKGGDITNFMGGSEINLSQADIQGVVTIDTTNIFGGTKLVIPASWDVKQEASAIFGGIDDKRDLHAIKPDPNKILIIDGTCIFGGIEIRNY